MLSRLVLVLQAAGLDRQLFDFLPPFHDGCVPPEVDVGGREVAQAFVVAAIVVVIHEGLDLAFEVAGQIVVFQQSPASRKLSRGSRKCHDGDQLALLQGMGARSGILG